MKALFIYNDRRIEEKGVHSALPVMYLVDFSDVKMEAVLFDRPGKLIDSRGQRGRTIEFRRHFLTSDGMVVYLEI